MNGRLSKIGRSETLILAVSLLLVFGVRVGYAWLAKPDPGVALNVDRWGTIARNLAEGQGYVYPYYLDKTSSLPVMPNAQRGPVPVLFFAGLFWIFGVSLWPVLVAQYLLDCGTAYLIYRIAGHIFYQPFVGLLASIGWALYVPEVTITPNAYSEPLFTFLLAFFVFCFMRALSQNSSRRMAVAGTLLGLGALSRPTALFLPGLLLPALLVRFRHLKTAVPHVLALIGTFALTLLPWSVRNYLVFEEFTPSTALLGFTLITDHYNISKEDFLPQIGLEGGLDREVRAITEQILARQGMTAEGRSPFELDRIRTAEAFRLIAQYPGRYLTLCLYRVLRLWFNVGYGAPPSWQSYLVMALNLLLLSLMIVQIVVFRGSWLRTAWPILALIAYFTLTHAAVHAQVRYIFPIMPYTILLANAGALNIAARLYPRYRWMAPDAAQVSLRQAAVGPPG